MNIIDMAKQANIGSALTHQGGDLRVWIEGADWHDELERFAVLVRNAALEEAAGVALNAGFRSNGTPAYEHIATAIRQLKETK